MSVCNLFKKIEKTTGTFFTFSQYAEDLTNLYLRNNHQQVVPSKFVAMQLDFSALKSKISATGATYESKTLNEAFPTVLQNVFENSVAYYKGVLGDDDWSPSIARSIFWNTLNDYGLIKPITDDDNSGKYYYDEIKYIGDINIQSHDNVNGIGYNEIYCCIPNTAKETRYYLDFADNQFARADKHTQDYIEGYDTSVSNMLSVIDFVTEQKFYYSTNNSSGAIPYRYYDFDKDDCKETESNQFNVNVVVVLYDVDGYENIPLGLYICGLIDDTTCGVTNIITKYTSNDDIMGAGTSWGLRICNRFTCTPNATTIIDTVVDNDSGEYAAFCEAMSNMSLSQTKMNDVVEEITDHYNDIQDHLDQFKNYRVNIPYVRHVNGEMWWFVNGRQICSVSEGTEGPQGVTGATGPQGPAGVPGLDGKQGETGTGGCLDSDVITDVAIGCIPAGTVLKKGSTLQSIIQQMFQDLTTEEKWSQVADTFTWHASANAVTIPSIVVKYKDNDTGLWVKANSPFTISKGSLIKYSFEAPKASTVTIDKQLTMTKVSGDPGVLAYGWARDSMATSQEGNGNFVDPDKSLEARLYNGTVDSVTIDKSTGPFEGAEIVNNAIKESSTMTVSKSGELKLTYTPAQYRLYLKNDVIVYAMSNRNHIDVNRTKQSLKWYKNDQIGTDILQASPVSTNFIINMSETKIYPHYYAWGLKDGGSPIMSIVNLVNKLDSIADNILPYDLVNTYGFTKVTPLVTDTDIVINKGTLTELTGYLVMLCQNRPTSLYNELDVNLATYGDTPSVYDNIYEYKTLNINDTSISTSGSTPYKMFLFTWSNVGFNKDKFKTLTFEL